MLILIKRDRVTSNKESVQILHDIDQEEFILRTGFDISAGAFS